MHTVLAAIDLGPRSPRVLYHAAGFARLLGARLHVLHVASEASEAARERVVNFCETDGPYEIDPSEIDVRVRVGKVSEAIHREARKIDARLIVMGSRGFTGLKKFLLGSTCELVLRDAPAPVLLVPSVDLDIVNIADRAVLNCGPVLAAVDLADTCESQLAIAGDLAAMAGQPLLLMTVAPRKVDGDTALSMLRERSHALEAARPHAVIVRRGDVAEEISRCARAEGAGLVVMGLRARRRGLPGAIASAVLQTRRAFVLAVPAM